MDEFQKYLQVKSKLANFVTSFYNYSLPVKSAKKLKLSIEDKYIVGDKYNCLFHRFDSDGQAIWQLLDLPFDIISYHDFYHQLELDALEAYDPLENYELKYLEILLKIAQLADKFFQSTIPIERARDFNVKYDSRDCCGKQVSICSVFSSTNGNDVFSLLGFEGNIIPRSSMLDLQEKLLEEIVDATTKQKKYVRKR